MFHVSYEDLGKRVRLDPRVPENATTGEDTKTPRICVAPRVSDCLRLTAWKDYEDYFYVYILDDRADVNFKLPKKLVPDWKPVWKEEGWILERAEFVRVGRVRMFRHILVTSSSPAYGWEHKEFEFIDTPDAMSPETYISNFRQAEEIEHRRKKMMVEIWEDMERKKQESGI